MDRKLLRQITTAEAVGELVGVAYRLHGGTGDAGARVMRGKGKEFEPRMSTNGTNKKRSDSCAFVSIRGQKKGKSMQIYIAGKITGLEFEDAATLFRQAAGMIREAGHCPLDPTVLVNQDEDRTYEDALLDALEIVLCSAEALYMLPNWRDSLGARIEHAIAVEKRLPIYYAETGIEVAK